MAEGMAQNLSVKAVASKVREGNVSRDLLARRRRLQRAIVAATICLVCGAA